MHIPSFGNANLLEILWTTEDILGLLIAIPNSWIALQNYLDLLRKKRNGIKRRMARSDLRLHGTVLVLIICFGLLGAAFMVTPSTQGTRPGEIAPAAAFLGLVLIGTNTWLLLWSWLEMKSRNYIIAEVVSLEMKARAERALEEK